jgi:hypothetical protein
MVQQTNSMRRFPASIISGKTFVGQHRIKPVETLFIGIMGN